MDIHVAIHSLSVIAEIDASPEKPGNGAYDYNLDTFDNLEHA